jgi:hypothetical protein
MCFGSKKKSAPPAPAPVVQTTAANAVPDVSNTTVNQQQKVAATQAAQAPAFGSELGATTVMGAV